MTLNLNGQRGIGIKFVSRHDAPLSIPQEPTGVVSGPGPWFLTALRAGGASLLADSNSARRAIEIFCWAV
jgi:hypothetical protein